MLKGRSTITSYLRNNPSRFSRFVRFKDMRLVGIVQYQINQVYTYSKMIILWFAKNSVIFFAF
jgi:hypothetical protein